jgi:uncharacterized protein YjiS (DUF1127 family)
MSKTDDHEDGALRRWQRLLARRWRERRSALAGWDELDARTLADIGIDRSETGSIDAEARGAVLRTRLRITEGLRHA